MLFDDLRTAWAAIPNTNPQPVDPSQRTEFVVHWWGSTLPDLTSHDACYALMLSTQRYHMQTRGFADIGYNGVICAHARSIEARGADLVGAHATGHNVVGYGWCFMTPLDAHPTQAMLDRMGAVYAECEARSGHDLLTYGHREVGSTDCPGDWIQTWVDSGMPVSSPEEPPSTEDPAITALREELRGLRSDMAGDVAEIRAHLDLVWAEVSAVTTRVTKAETDIVSLMARVARLEARRPGK